MKIHEVLPYLCVSDTDAAIRFYSEAFDAREKFRLTEPSGRIGHAEIEIGDMLLLLADEFPEYGIHSPAGLGGTPVTMHLHVDDADAWVERAIAAGAKLEREPTNHFYGERSGSVYDPFGHRWLIGHDIEDVSHEEMQRRYLALFEK